MAYTNAVSHNISAVRAARKAYQQSLQPVKAVTPPPAINPNLWDDEPVVSVKRFTVRCYNYSGIGVLYEMDVEAASAEDASWVMQRRYRLSASQAKCIYAFEINK